MSASSPSLARRALGEHKHLVVLLVVVLVLNVLVYAFFVYPLSERVNSVEERTHAAEMELANARIEHIRASSTLTGKDQAARELDTFYSTVLPKNFGEARSLVYPRLDMMARAAGVRPRNIKPTTEIDSDRTLARVKVEIELVGTYSAVRRFIHDLEQAPEFMTIDHITLSEEGANDDGLLTLTLELSTYYRGGQL